MSAVGSVVLSRLRGLGGLLLVGRFSFCVRCLSLSLGVCVAVVGCGVVFLRVVPRGVSFVPAFFSGITVLCV